MNELRVKAISLETPENFNPDDLRVDIVVPEVLPEQRRLMPTLLEMIQGLGRAMTNRTCRYVVGELPSSLSVVIATSSKHRANVYAGFALPPVVEPSGTDMRVSGFQTVAQFHLVPAESVRLTRAFYGTYNLASLQAAVKAGDARHVDGRFIDIDDSVFDPQPPELMDIVPNNPAAALVALQQLANQAQ